MKKVANHDSIKLIKTFHGKIWVEMFSLNNFNLMRLGTVVFLKLELQYRVYLGKFYSEVCFCIEFISIL